MPEIIEPKTVAELDQVRQLVREFVAWHKRMHPDHRHLIERYFDTPQFEAELAGLPGEYTKPHGALLLALANGRPAGCVAMHAHGASVVEMKRMYVSDAFRGQGVGRALAEGILSAARAAGYKRMLLETSRDQRDAIGLYEKIGFTRIAPYYEMPADMADWIVCFEMKL